MNQLRDILIVVFIALALGLAIGHPEDWTWETPGGPYVVSAVAFLTAGRPWSIVILLALALSLFMTRLKY